MSHGVGELAPLIRNASSSLPETRSHSTGSALDPPRKIVANLPYNIATPLLLGWLDRIGDYESLTLMFQREVAERLTAVPGTKSYGRLSVLVQWLTDAQILFDVRRALSFHSQGDIERDPPRSASRAPRTGDEIRARTRHRRGLRPTPQDAAASLKALGHR